MVIVQESEVISDSGSSSSFKRLKYISSPETIYLISIKSLIDFGPFRF